MASFPALMMGPGVSKSGSPAAKLTMSFPASRRLLAKSDSSIVLEGFSFVTLGLSDVSTGLATVALLPASQQWSSRVSDSI